MSLHKEINFENEICEHLAAHGWLYAEGDAAKYDRARALFPEDVLAWVQATQPKAWEAIVKNHGTHAAETLLTRLRASLDQRGTLDVLRHGIEMLGLRGKLPLAQFKPALGMNPDILSRYAANRLRVVRQVRYSLHNENCIDLVLFLNGIPVATVELKTDFTQSVGDAIDQYRFDRHPKPKGQAAEPLLAFPSGALVHFAVSNREVHMTTRLEGPATRFLPFNQGDHGAAGNPLPEQGGHRTAYLWEQVWARESWLEILGRYLVAQRDEKKQIKTVIFPRFHQLDATRKLLAAVLAAGTGRQIPDPAFGRSGKTNSIAWSAHFLADLHDADDHKAVRLGAGRVRPQRDRRAVAGSDFRLRAHDRRGRRHQGREQQQERRTGRGPLRRQEDRGLHDPDVPVRAGGRARTGGDQGQTVRRDRRRGAQFADGRSRRQAQGGAVPRGTGGTGRRRRGQHGRRAGRADGGTGRRHGHHLRRLHRHAEDQDDGAVRHPAGPQPTGGQGQSADAVPRLFDAAGHRGEVHPRRAPELHDLQAGLQAGHTTARNWTTRKSNAARP